MGYKIYENFQTKKFPTEFSLEGKQLWLKLGSSLHNLVFFFCKYNQEKTKFWLDLCFEHFQWLKNFQFRGIKQGIK